MFPKKINETFYGEEGLQFSIFGLADLILTFSRTHFWSRFLIFRRIWFYLGIRFMVTFGLDMFWFSPGA